MPRTPMLTSKEYTKNIKKLTYHDIVRRGNTIMPMEDARAFLSNKFGRQLSDRVITLKCKYGQIAPIGEYSGAQYFLRKDIEALHVEPRDHDSAKKQLTREEYTNGIEKLTSEVITAYGDRIIAMADARALLSEKAKRELSESYITQKCKRGKIKPMGEQGRTLYFWAEEIRALYVRRRNA